MAPWSEKDIPDLTGKRALVTGGASGIGYEAARALAQAGAEVLIADRNEVAAREALQKIRALKADARVDFLPLDLSSQNAVKTFSASLLAEGKPLDLLINNAGIQPLSTRRTSADGYELTFGIGHLGHFTLTGLLLPLLLAAPRPRVVTVSSMMHAQGSFDWDDLQMERGYTSQRPYNQTKLANLLFARELQRRVDAAGKKLLSVAVHPGVAKTNIGTNRRNLGRFGLMDHLVDTMISIMNTLWGQSAQGGALPTLYAATTPDVQGGGFYGPDGFREMKGSPAPAKLKASAQDMDVAKRLWEVSEELTGIRYEALSR